ncbi:hypothetical protein [Nostoc sp. ChiVER01]|nr:hypothetical protein [Nostoc sp. ChiVER01]MDZ8224853.1 hypothetical protein [Nostoc sp. ChiVER01]
MTLLRTLVPRYRFANATATLTPVAYGGKPAYSAGSPSAPSLRDTR